MTPHRVLIVGVGSIGERHLRCFAATGRADAGSLVAATRLAIEFAQRRGG